MGLDQHQKAIKATHIQRSPVILPGKDRAKTSAHFIGKKTVSILCLCIFL
jgi:hypothetical protein